MLCHPYSFALDGRPFLGHFSMFSYLGKHQDGIGWILLSEESREVLNSSEWQIC